MVLDVLLSSSLVWIISGMADCHDCRLAVCFLGVLYATMEVDMKRILAYSSVEIWAYFGAFGCGMLLMAMHLMPLAIVAFTAAAVHAFSHSLMKGLMFMSAGAVMHATGSKNIEKLGGLLKNAIYCIFHFDRCYGIILSAFYQWFL